MKKLFSSFICHKKFQKILVGFVLFLIASSLLYGVSLIALLLFWLIAVVAVFIAIIVYANKKEMNYEVESESNDRTIGYYISSEQLFFSNFIIDVKGVPLNNYGEIIGKKYNPSYIAWWALTNINKYNKTNDTEYLNKFWIQIEWLMTSFRDYGKLGFVWLYDFDWQAGPYSKINSPWISAMSQGLAISALVRAYMLTNDKKYLTVCRNALNVFSYDIADGGVRSKYNGYYVYEEYPVFPETHILDGFIFSLLGIYDYWSVTKEKFAYELYQIGIEGLKNNLRNWDFKGIWSLYGVPKLLCTPLYNKLNSELLKVLYTLSKDSILIEYSKKWEPETKGIFNKLRILFYDQLLRIIFFIDYNRNAIIEKD